VHRDLVDRFRGIPPFKIRVDWLEFPLVSVTREIGKKRKLEDALV
jgi:hypothetical protein